MNILSKEVKILDPHNYLQDKALVLCFDRVSENGSQGRFYITDIKEDGQVCGLRSHVVIDLTNGENFKNSEVFMPMICVSKKS